MSQEETWKQIRALPKDIRDAMLAGNLDMLNANIILLTKTLAKSIPRGIVDNRSKNVKRLVGSPLTLAKYGSPWFSFSLYNDGPDPVYVQIQTIAEKSLNPHLTRSNEVYEIDMRSPQIKALYLWVANQGDHAEIRFSGVQ